MKKSRPQGQGVNLRSTINEITEQLITELQGAELTATGKISFLKTLLPYSVGKLPTAAVNYQIFSGQPTSGRVIELSENGGRKDTSSILENFPLADGRVGITFNK